MADARSVVLFVSPYDIDHERLRIALKGSAWRVHGVTNCREAWMALHQENVDAIITEPRFPDGLGWSDLIDEIRNMNRKTPVIVASRIADSSLWASAVDNGAFDVLLKPLEAREISHVLNLARRAHTTKRRPGSQSLKPTVLVADVPEIQALVSAVLEPRGFEVLTPAPAKAEGVLHSRKVDLVVTSRPDRLLTGRPDVRALYVSVVPDPVLLRGLPNKVVGTLRKPFTPAELLVRVQQLMAKPSAATVSVRVRQRYNFTLRGQTKDRDEIAARVERLHRRFQELRTAVQATAELGAALWRTIVNNNCAA